MQQPMKLPLVEPRSRDSAFVTSTASVEAECSIILRGSPSRSLSKSPRRQRQSTVHVSFDPQEPPSLPSSVKPKLAHYMRGSVRYSLDFNSPRTLDAAAQLGICFEDCVKK